jgi:hypothetical protein
MSHLGQVVASDQPPYEGCERLGYNRMPFMEPDLQAKIDAAKASGRAIVPTPTGRVLNQGTRSETVEAAVWSCPPQYAKLEKPDQAVSPSTAPTPMVETPAGESRFPIMPVAGLAAAGLLAYLLFK